MQIKVVYYSLSSEFLIANFALEVAVLFMRFRVYSSVRDLIKFQIAVWHGALERPFVCMDPQVVKKIVPLLKELPTVIVITRENLSPSSCSSTCVRDQ